jgi:hypothetical protein
VGTPIYDWINTKKKPVAIWIIHTMPTNGGMVKFDPYPNDEEHLQKCMAISRRYAAEITMKDDSRRI